MKTARLAIALVAAAIAGAATGYWVAARHGSYAVVPAAPASDKRVLYWYDPMHPQQRFDKPGKSPFMDMQLVPKYADEDATGGSVTIDPRTAQNFGMRTAPARPGSLAPRLEVAGGVEYNERAVVLVQPRTGGFVEKLHVRAALDAVRAGDPLADVLLPDWAAAQEEYLLARRIDAAAPEALASAARQRLVLLGMTEEQIAAVERAGNPLPGFTLRAPISGVIAELGAREGMSFAAGATLFRIAGLGTVWVVAQVPESQAAALAPGAAVEVRVPAYPGEVHRGHVSAVLPELNAATRTVRARIEVANPRGRLKPGMYASVALSAGARQALLVPIDAVIRTGERSVVIVAGDAGRFRSVEVETGMEAGGDIEIRRGLKPGDRVVVSGQFLIDSEAGLRGALERLSMPDGAAGSQAPRPQGLHTATGRVTAVNPDAGRIELDHDPVPSMKWPAMQMEFAVRDRKPLAGIRPGDTVQFELREDPDADGNYVIERIAPSPALRPRQAGRSGSKP